MAATNKFKPKASSNVIEGVTPVEEDSVVDNTTPVTQEAPEKENEVTETTSTVTFEDKSSKKTPSEKNVKIRTRVDHSCCIGGVRYHFEKGKQTNVPESVKAILLQADLLMPL